MQSRQSEAWIGPVKIDHAVALQAEAVSHQHKAQAHFHVMQVVIGRQSYTYISSLSNHSPVGRKSLTSHSGMSRKSLANHLQVNDDKALSHISREGTQIFCMPIWVQELRVLPMSDARYVLVASVLCRL